MLCIELNALVEFNYISCIIIKFRYTDRAGEEELKDLSTAMEEQGANNIRRATAVEQKISFKTLSPFICQPCESGGCRNDCAIDVS